MRYFYSLAQTGRKANAPLDEVRKCFEKAAHLAALAAPYRHPRLSAVKLNKDPIAPRAKASMDELRAEMQKHLEILAPVLDLEALLAPGDGIANREVQEECSSGTGSTLSAPVSSSVSASPSANAPRGIRYRHD